VVTALTEMGMADGQEGDRRPLRPVVQGIHAGDGQGRLRRAAKPKPKNHFTIGINDDVTHTSLAYDPEFSPPKIPARARLFYGLGADGTVGANKNSIKIIGEETDNYAQGYFVYDSKKSGAITVSHLRFGPKPHALQLPDRQGQLRGLPPVQLPGAHRRAEGRRAGRHFLLNSPFGPDEVWDHLPRTVQRQIIDKKLKFYVIDGYEVAKKTGMGGASTPSCRPASSPSAACCRARKPSPPSSTPSRRPTASAAKRGAEELRRRGCRPRAICMK
jgi:hypothetical protein